MRVIRCLFVVTLTAVLLAGCGKTQNESLAESLAATETSVAPETSASAATEPTTQETAPETAPGPMLTTITGGQIDLGEVLGQDAVLWFWAPW